MTDNKYQKVRAEGGIFQENKDCAVIALSLACRVSYERAREVLAIFGRQHGKSTYFHSMTYPAVKVLGCKLTPVKRARQASGSWYTPRTVGTRFKRGYYLCRVSRHIFALVNGQVLDHTEGRCHRIREIYRVTKVRKPKEG